MITALVAVQIVLVLAEWVLARRAGIHAGRAQVLGKPEQYGLTPISAPTIVLPTTATEEDRQHAQAAFLAAVRAGRLHLSRGPEIPQ